MILVYMSTEITERQQEIINVSLALIAESGIQSLTIKNLAKKIGFAESAIYRHYENKIQILLAILDFFKQNTEHFFTNQLNSNDNALIKIENLFTNHFKFQDTKLLELATGLTKKIIPLIKVKEKDIWYPYYKWVKKIKTKEDFRNFKIQLIKGLN